MTEPINVLYFIPGFNYGGIETTTINICKFTDHSKIHIEVLTETKKNNKNLKELEKLGCKVHFIDKLDIKHPFKYFLDLVSFFEKNQHYHVVHSFNISRTPFLFLGAIRKGIKHRIYHARTSRSSSILLKRLVFRGLISLGALLSTNTMACSEVAAKYFFGNNEETVILKNGIDTSQFLFDADLREKVRLQLNINDKFVIGHVGRFCEAKNHLFIIDVFKEVCEHEPNSLLLLIGDGPLMAEVKDYIAKCNLEEQVILVGAVSNVCDYLQAMDVFIFPSIYEGFGNVVIEAQASGLRVISSDRVPKAVKITELVDFISLESPIDCWVQSILKHKNNTIRENKYSEIVRNGYDIVENARFLENYYIDLVYRKF